MTLVRTARALVVAVFLCSSAFGALGADDCWSVIQLDNVKTYEIDGRAYVAIRLTNIAYSQLMLLRSRAPRNDFCYGVRPLSDTLPVRKPLLLSRCTEEHSLPPGRSIMFEVPNPYGTRDIQVTFSFVPEGTADTCLVSIDMPEFASQLSPLLTAQEAVQAAMQAGYPCTTDPRWKARLGWREDVGRLWEIRARVTEDDTARVLTDSLAWVGAFSGRFIGTAVAYAHR